MTLSWESLDQNRDLTSNIRHSQYRSCFVPFSCSFSLFVMASFAFSLQWSAICFPFELVPGSHFALFCSCFIIDVNPLIPVFAPSCSTTKHQWMTSCRFLKAYWTKPETLLSACFSVTVCSPHTRKLDGFFKAEEVNYQDTERSFCRKPTWSSSFASTSLLLVSEWDGSWVMFCLTVVSNVVSRKKEWVIKSSRVGSAKAVFSHFGKCILPFFSLLALTW